LITNDGFSLFLILGISSGGNPISIAIVVEYKRSIYGLDRTMKLKECDDT